MKKRVFSLFLAVLMCMSLCVSAFANGDAEESTAPAEASAAKEAPDPREEAWTVALNLADAADGAVHIFAEMSGKAAGSGYDEKLTMTVSNMDTAFADGGHTSYTQFYVSGSSSVTKQYTVAEVPEMGVYYWDKTITGTGDDSLVAEHYDEAPADAFGDFTSQFAKHMAALGDGLLGAQEDPGDPETFVDPSFTYELKGDDLHEFVTACCPELIKGCGELDWSQISAQMHAEPYHTTVTIDLSSPSLAEAILGSLQDVESVTDGSLEMEVQIMVLHDDYSQYKENHYDKDKLDQTGLQFAETGGACPAVPSLTDMIWKVCETGWNAANETESAKDALRAQLTGGASAEEEPSAEEGAGE